VNRVPMRCMRGPSRILLLFIVVTLLSLPSLSRGDEGASTIRDWEVKYQRTLNRKYVDEEKGVVGFRIEEDSIYVMVNDEMCSCSFMFLAMEWAKKYYQERQKQAKDAAAAQSAVSAYVVLGGEIMNDVTYDEEHGYH